MTFLRLLPLKAWLAIGAVALVLLALGAYRYQARRADRAEARLAPVEASSVALDKVATETPIIRQDQKEKEREVDQIQGSDQRLPDGYGRELQSIRLRDKR